MVFRDIPLNAHPRRSPGAGAPPGRCMGLRGPGAAVSSGGGCTHVACPRSKDTAEGRGDLGARRGAEVSLERCHGAATGPPPGVCVWPGTPPGRFAGPGPPAPQHRNDQTPPVTPHGATRTPPHRPPPPPPGAVHRDRTPPGGTAPGSGHPRDIAGGQTPLGSPRHRPGPPRSRRRCPRQVRGADRGGAGRISRFAYRRQPSQ